MTIYDRRNKELGVESDPESGFSNVWDGVDDKAIHAVAENSGAFKDFKKYSSKS